MQNKKFKSIQVYLGLVVVLAFVIANIASAANTGTVTATVTLQNISVTVAPGTISYGTLALSGVMTTLSGGVTGQQTATNAGNQAESFNIEGANTTGTGPNWNLVSTADSSPGYEHRWCKSGCGTNASPTLGTAGAGFTPLSTGYATLATNVASGSGTQTFDMYIKMPTGGTTNFNAQTANVTVQAVSYP